MHKKKQGKSEKKKQGNTQKNKRGPDPLILAFFVFLASFVLRLPLLFFVRFSFPSIFGVQGREKPLLFSGFPLLFFFFQKKHQESPRQTKPKKGPKRKVHEFYPFLCEFWRFSLGKQARFTSRTFVPDCPCEKFMNWPFFGWFAGVTPEKTRVGGSGGLEGQGG